MIIFLVRYSPLEKEHLLFTTIAAAIARATATSGVPEDKIDLIKIASNALSSPAHSFVEFILPRFCVEWIVGHVPY